MTTTGPTFDIIFLCKKYEVHPLHSNDALVKISDKICKTPVAP